MKEIHRRSLLSLLAVAVLSCSSWAWAQDRAQAVRFDIAAQPVGPALNEFGKQTGLHVVVDSDLASGMKSPGVRGEFSPDAALSRLLADTGLRYRFVDEDTVAVLGPEVGLRLKGETSWSDALRMAQADAGSAASSREAEEKRDAQGAAEGSDGVKLEEIVVTAQKRGEQNVTDVPISVSVLSGANLEESGARGVSDVLNEVGGVNLVEFEPGRSTISIRGAAAGAVTLTGSSPVGYYLDELPFAFITNAFLPDANAFDLQRIEVLRGPQGTLYGAGSLNGVVRILTNDANLSNFEIRGRARYAPTKDGDSSQSGDLVVNVPVIEGRLGVRAVASYADLGGFIDSATSTNFNDSEVQNYRVKINAKPTDRLTLALGASFSRIDNHGSSGANDDYTTPFSDDQNVEHSYDAYNLIVTYDFLSFSAQSSTGYIDLTGRGHYDFLLAGLFQTSLTDNLSAESFTEEVRFASHFQGPWQVSGGVFYRDVDQLLNQGIFDFGAPYVFPLEFLDESTSHAIFGEVTRSFMDGRLELTGGVRYFEDTVTTTERSTLTTGTAGPLLPEVESSFHAVTWRATVNYHPSEDQTLYASIATGFRSGFNQAPTSLAVEPDLPPVEADDLMTYEIGAKGELSDGRFFYDSALYYTEWEGAQQFRITALGSAAVINADRSSGLGFDASVVARLTGSVSVNASVGWNGLEFRADTFQQGVVLFPDGDRMNLSPELTAGVGAEYRFPVGQGALEGFASGDIRYTSEQVFHDVGGGQHITTRSDEIYNANLRVGVEADSWTLSVFAENLSDERGALAPGTASDPYPRRQRPRTIGVQGTFNF